MTPGARVAAMIQILDSVLEGIPTEKALTNWGRSNRFAGSKDRAAIRDFVFQAIRCRRSAGAWPRPLSARAWAIGSLSLNKLPLNNFFATSLGDFSISRSVFSTNQPHHHLEIRERIPTVLIFSEALNL